MVCPEGSRRKRNVLGRYALQPNFQVYLHKTTTLASSIQGETSPEGSDLA
jgi:hypothetical protein